MLKFPHINFPCFSCIDLSRGRISSSLKSGSEGSSLFLKQIMRIAFLMLTFILFRVVGQHVPQLSRL